VTGHSQTVGTVTKMVGYAYTNGRLTTLTTPSGQVVSYGYAANGEVSSISVNGTPVITDVLYEPMGPTAGWTWGNGMYAVRTHDLDGKITQVDSAGLKTYAYDDAFRITGITDTVTPANSWAYGYDSLDRLNAATSTAITQGWTYDANGNRLTETGSSPSTYSISGSSNRIGSISGSLARTYGYDASGNTTGYASLAFTYNNRGRMTSAASGGTTTSYIYNAVGQRVKKSDGVTTTYFSYDEAGHLLGEYDGTGALIEETVWFGDIPVATLRPAGGGVDIYYVHTDHLNAPRRVSRPSDNVIVWRWDSDPFGTSAADEDPDGDMQVFVYGLRFPGQYADPETGLNYNYFRDYDPQSGGYLESDPIGLAGGSETYSYTGANPIVRSDFYGLAWGDFPPPPPGYDPVKWIPGRFANNGRWFLEDPSGNRWIVHAEDVGHWRHWDKQDKNGKGGGSWPPNSKKMWPLQKRPRTDQCERDPSGDATPWSPPDSDYFLDYFGEPLWLFPHELPISSQPRPMRIPFRVPVPVW
jgi:RHS repeat-associated protein